MSSELIRRFEPILYFETIEDFYPSDAKRYMEHCALWNADRPFGDTSSWNRTIATEKIAAAINEISQPGETDDTYIGSNDGTGSTFLTSDTQKERFLNLSDWESNKQHAAVQKLAGLYHDPVQGEVSGGIPALIKSRFWYHAEFFDTALLNRLTKEHPVEIDLPKLLSDRSRFKNPCIICYYLFFPGHIEFLQGCTGVDAARRFGNFAGEWNCVAVLLDREDLETEQDYKPKYLGLASRNAHKDGIPMPEGRVIDHDRRVGMVVYDWDDVQVFPSPEGREHVKLFVARNTHSLYVTPGPKNLFPVATGDSSVLNCGSTEPVAGALEGEGDGDDSSVAEDVLIVLGKIALGAIAGAALVGGAFLGYWAGVAWGIDEVADASFTAPPSLPTPDDPQQDFPPDVGDSLFVIHPRDFTPPDALPGSRVSWPAKDSVEINGRKYTIIVDRINRMEELRQVWLPGWDEKGYEGRWGPRVSSDPFGRRSGMRFPQPEFVQMFLIALTKHLSK